MATKHRDKMVTIDTNKLLLGKILGEIYRIQTKAGMPLPVNQAHVYGLLNGLEFAVDRELEGIGFVSTEKLKYTSKVLNKIWENPSKLAAFKGFYDIEAELDAGGVDRETAIKIITYFKADGRFQELIEKMNSNHSPIECKDFNLDD